MPLAVGTARSDVVSKNGGTPALFDKLPNRQGWAAWMPLGMCKARSDVESWGGGTPPPHDKLNIRQGWAAWMPQVVGTARSDVESWGGGTPLPHDKLPNRQGRRFGSTAQAIEAETPQTPYPAVRSWSGKRGFWLYSAKNAPLWGVRGLLVRGLC